MKTPRTPRERALNLKAAGAVIEKLPSFARDEYRVTCPKCGGSVPDGRGMFFLLPPEVRDRDKNNRVSLADTKVDPVTLLGRTVEGYTRSGDLLWVKIRAHVLACGGAPANKFTRRIEDDSEAASAIRAVHNLRRALETASPKIRELLRDELREYLPAIAVGEDT